jgi:uncharacterized radical SAM superfamily Fe-S cluster-containing enzyme
MPLRTHTFLGTTQSLCPECLALVPAKIVAREGRVYFRKRCPAHGEREDFVCSDASQYDRMEYSVPGRLPAQFGTEADKGCPFDCGLCTEHEQHTCVGLVEITASCNLSCPMCYAASAPGGMHLPLEACRRAIDQLVEREGRPEVLQLSGGEPTIHPQFFEILSHAVQRPIDYVLINTNGLRFAHDEGLVERVAGLSRRIEVYLQFDGFREETSRALRGESLVAAKLRAVENLGRAGIHVTLVATLQAGVNDDEMGAVVRYAVERPWITGVSFQPATYSGRHVLPETLERRITFPDVIRGIAEQTGGMFRESDFMPLPCAHPNCHSITYAYRAGGDVAPLARFIDIKANIDLLANGISFTRPAARDLIEKYLGRLGCCAGGCEGGTGENGTAAGREGAKPLRDIGRSSSPPTATNGLPILGGAAADLASLAAEFFAGTLAQRIGAEDIFRITITSFLDAYNFDVRRLMKCCIHHVLPSGHLIPFCAYNVLYRDGHVPLPPLAAKVPA